MAPKYLINLLTTLRMHVVQISLLRAVLIWVMLLVTMQWNMMSLIWSLLNMSIGIWA